jgi:hypothetical protein
MIQVTVTKKEQKAIKELESLAKRWPKTISLFSWSGSLYVTKNLPDDRFALIESIAGIPNDGGDPTDVEAEQSPDITWE